MNRLILIAFGVIILFVILMLTQIILSYMLMYRLSKLPSQDTKKRITEDTNSLPTSPPEKLKRTRLGLSRLS
jgi:hypothetical protein